MKKLSVFLMLAVMFFSQSAMAALTAAQVDAAITYCLNNGILNSDPVVLSGGGDAVTQVNCMYPDLEASPDQGTDIGYKHILIVTE